MSEHAVTNPPSPSSLPASHGSLDSTSRGELEGAHRVAETLRARMRAAIRGRDEVIDLVLVALFADGHVLLEDFPGSGKTTLARALGLSIAEHSGSAQASARLPEFRRIQFTPDLLPSDITGTNVFDVNQGSFAFRRGPIFAHVVLADEINRTSPKVQAAMLEAMAEKQVTIDNETHPLDELFFVIATQNPLDVAGTYPLPTPQLDRFLFKIRMEHIERAAELELLSAYPVSALESAASLPQVTRDQVLEARSVLRAEVQIASAIKDALVDLARGIRSDPRVLQGASTRSLILMLPALQARALLAGRDYVSPDDLQALASRVFPHRLECAAGVEDPMDVVREHVGEQLERLAKHTTKG